MSKRPTTARGLRREAKAARGARSGVLFNVSTLLQEPLGSVREYEVSAAAVELEEEAVEVSGRVHLLRTDGSVLVRATLDTAVREVCDTCLEAYVEALALEVREEFWPEVDPLTQIPVEPPEGREGFPIVEGHLDLGEAIRQYVEMARPMRARCGDTCPGPPAAARGVIDTGGESPPDARWSALASLRAELAPEDAREEGAG